MSRWLTLAIIALLPCSASAAVQPGNDRCWEDPNRAPCLQASANDLVSAYGARPIEAHRDAGDRVIRVSYWHNQDLALIAFVRAPGREPRAYVSFPRRAAHPAPAMMEAAVPEAVWDEAMIRAAYADRAFVPVPERESDAQSVCIHPTVYLFEASDPAVRVYGMPARIRRHSANTCDDAPLLRFAVDLRRLALPLFPACDALDPGAWGDEIMRLQTCQGLSGDRLAAARIVNAAAAFQTARVPNDLPGIRDLIDHDAPVDWNGRRRGTGDQDPAAFWLARTAEDHVSHVSIETAEGMAADRVRITGRLFRNRPGTNDGSLQQARFEQLWSRTYSDVVVTSLTVGQWERRSD